MITLFKFRKIDKYLLKSLINSDIYFARPKNLNDPFDCRVDILNAFENAIKRIPPQEAERFKKIRVMSEFFSKLQLDREQLGVCSFSLELNNSLLWSHYADNHRGICLTYSFPEEFFINNSSDILGISSVDYGINPLSDWFVQNALNHSSFNDFGMSLLKKALTVKDKIWDYEKEVRIIRRTEGEYIIDKSYLKQICFGLDTPEVDVRLLRKLTNNVSYEVGICQMKRNKYTDFGLQPIDL